jgi:hypothetical protein
MTISHKYKDILQVASMALFGSLKEIPFLRATPSANQSGRNG